MFLLVLTVFFSHFLFGFNAKPAESGVLFRFHLSLFNVNKSVTKVQTFIYADNTAFTERLPTCMADLVINTSDGRIRWCNLVVQVP